MAAEKMQEALALQNAGRYADAELIYREILREEPRNPDALHCLGVLAYLGKNYQDALMLIDQAIAVAPGYGAALNTRGSILLALSQPEAALEAYQQALAVKPASVATLSNLGNVLLELKRPEDALAFLDRALALAPDHRDALYNRANAKLKLERREDAVADYRRCVVLYPDHLQAFYNCGIALQELGRIDEALESYRQALRIDPGHAESHYNTALCRLAGGDLRHGFADYEWRWRVAPQVQSKWNASPRRWLGKEDLSGKTLLVHSEQGFGDTIQFARFVPEVAKRAARVIFEVQPPLKALVGGLGQAIEVIAEGEPYPAYDFDCPLLSLPHALGVSRDTIPPPLMLGIGTDLMEKWRALLPEAHGLRVGLAWSGRPDHPNDHHRSINLQALAPLTSAGATFISLQKDYKAGERERLKDQGNILDFSEHVRDRLAG